MQVKTFKADDMPEALRMVKNEFGADAMILSSRKEQQKGLLGRFHKPYFEVTAAMDPAPRVTLESRPEKEKERSGIEPNTLDVFQKSMLAPMARELKELRAQVATLTREKSAEIRQPAPPPLQEYRKPERESQIVSPTFRILPGSEADELKKILLRSFDKPGVPEMVNSVRQQALPTGGNGTQAVAALTRELLAEGIEETLVAPLLKPVSDAAARGATAASLRELLKKTVASGINCSGSVKVKKNGPRILALVGPTGVGKTTTIAKLAALAYKQGVPVALITIDTFRVGAIAQLQTYSEIMNIPMEIASTPTELARSIAAHADKKLIFIDTAGRSPRDQKRIQEMKAFLNVNPAIETHLCLSATTRDKDLIQTVKRFSELPVSRMLFTKLDESMSFGCIVNTHLQTKMPLSYFTTGQRVPEDIEAATPQRVAELVVRENKL